jgi:hypothetical protein
MPNKFFISKVDFFKPSIELGLRTLDVDRTIAFKFKT